MSAIVGPIPPYSNPPIEPQYFQPSNFFISAISLGIRTVVTTSVNHNYVIGQLVRLIIPPSYGARQLNEQLSYVVDIPALNQVALDVNSFNDDAFINSGLATPAQINAVGDINNGIISATGRSVPTTNIPGAFINISPL
jgi:hypothetical protein